MLNLLLYFSLAFAQVGTRSVKDIDIARGQTSFKNYVKNPDQEVVGTFVPFVTASGGSLTVETSAPIDGKSIRIDSSASAQTYKWDLKPYDTRFGELSGQQCYVEFQYSMAGANANPNRDGYKWYVEDGSGNKLTSETQLISTYDELSVADGPPRLQQNWFVCPSIPLSWKFVIESTASDATRLIVDNIKLGLDFKIGQVSNIGVFASLKYTGVVNCIFSQSSSVFVSFPANADCNTPIVKGNAQVPATKIPAIPLVNGQRGWYKVTATGAFVSNTTLAWGWRFFDGTTAFGVNAGNNQNSDVNADSIGSVVGFIEYTQPFLTKQIEIQGYAETVAHQIKVNQAGKNDLEITVEYLGPSIGAVGVSQQDYDWTSYTPTFTGFGTVTSIDCRHKREGTDLLIMCNHTNGTTTGTEARVSLPNNLTISSTNVPSLRTCGTPAIRSETLSTWPTPLCEPSVGYVTFGFVNGTSTQLQKRNGSDFASSTAWSWTARVPIAGWTTGLGPYYFTETVRTPGVAKPVLVSFRISNSGVVSNQLGGAVQACTNAIPSVCTWVPGFWKDATKVNCASSDLEGGWTIWVRNYTSSTVSISSYSGGLERLYPATLICHGEIN